VGKDPLKGVELDKDSCTATIATGAEAAQLGVPDSIKVKVSVDGGRLVFAMGDWPAGGGPAVDDAGSAEATQALTAPATLATWGCCLYDEGPDVHGGLDKLTAAWPEV